MPHKQSPAMIFDSRCWLPVTGRRSPLFAIRGYGGQAGHLSLAAGYLSLVTRNLSLISW